MSDKGQTRKDEGLQALGQKTKYRDDYAPEVLETFLNKHPENDYWVRFNCPEFTTLCPITGQPDFAEIRIMYIPDELKGLFTPRGGISIWPYANYGRPGTKYERLAEERFAQQQF